MEQQDWRQIRRDRQAAKQNGKMVFGFIIAGFGLLMLLKMLNLLPTIYYSVHFGWLILVIIGIAIGIKSNFRNNAWIILTLIGAVHLVPAFYIGDVSSRRIVWPTILIVAGLAMVFRKRRFPDNTPAGGTIGATVVGTVAYTQDADTINMDVTFGGRKEIITSKSFRGGRVRATFAGAELNLATADSGTQPMVLEIHASFAGVELIVPSHWEIQNEINPTLGSVEDHRMIRTHDTSTEKRVLILRGSCSFGSVEIKSY